MSAPKYESYKGDDGQWRWRLLGGNGEGVIPPEGHSTKTDAKRAFVRATALMVEALAAMVEKP